MFKKISLSFKIIGFLLITALLLINSKNIYNILPKKTKFIIKKKLIYSYENLSQNNKILVRVLGLDPFGHLQKRYKRTNPQIENLDNDYNVKFLPNTQNGDFLLSKLKVDFIKKGDVKKDTGYSFFQPFYLEIFDDKLILVNNDGEILFSSLSQLFNKKRSNLKTKKIKSNLKTYKVMGTLTHNSDIFVSYLDIKNNCQIYNIASAQINFDNLLFKKVFTSQACGSNLNAGRMSAYTHNGKNGLLATVGGEKINQPTDEPQNPSSDIGKILFIDLESNKKIIYSSGHRNPQGLLVDNNRIIATEHGPEGGDEINIIKKGKNYGWPISSYGNHYSHLKKKKEKVYLKSHSSSGFVEPIYSFVPSIGISQIIKVPKDFSSDWQDNYLLASLNGASLYRIKFNDTFSGITYLEKIFINRRVRDMKYSKKHKAFIMALEDWQEIGILKPVPKY
tara:strand:+ start:5089 stop:6435 length:1347 start_codon:yes stop_codon:yes gene_type:complete